MSGPVYGISRTGPLPCVWLRCAYSDRDRAKSVAGARWHGELKVWYWPLTRSGDETAILSALKAKFPAATLETATPLPRPSLPDLPECGPPLQSLVGRPVYPWRREPYAHQRETVSASLLRHRLLIMDEMGCVSGDTEIQVNRAGAGRRYKVKDAYRRFNQLEQSERRSAGRSHNWDPKIPTYCKALVGDRLRQHRVLAIEVKGVRPVVELTLDSGRTLRLTPDNRVACPDGWALAGDLQPGAEVLVNGSKAGAANPNWKGGRFVDNDGYVRSTGQRGHPRANTTGQVYEHILVMEESLGRFVGTDEVVHHINEDRADNRLENLELKTVLEHRKHHGRKGNFANFDGGTAGTGGRICFIPKVDRVVSVLPAGEEEVYDVWMEGPHHNFVANGIVVANCGKTSAAIEAACTALESGIVSRVYIVAPATVRQTWKDEINACAWIAPDDVAVVRGNPPATNPERIPGLSDPQYRRRLIDRRATWTIMGYEAATIEKDRLDPLVKGQFLVCDEAHYLKSPRAARTKAVLSWKPARAILQTGTPVVNSPSDAYCMATFCEPGLLGRSIYDFRDRFVIVKKIHAGGRAFDKEVGYKNLDEASRRLLSIGLRRLKKDCLDLPPKVRTRRYCEMPPAQFEAYAMMLGLVGEDLRGLLDEHSGKVPMPLVISQLVRLQQVADGFYPDPDNPERNIWIPDACKFAATDELLEEAVANGRKVLLWTRFVPMARKLVERYAEHGAAYLAGEVPTDLRESRIASFREDPARKVLALTMGVGGLGLNLQVADCEVFISRWWSPAVNFQCEDRCHRSGQRNQVDIHILLAESTIDERVNDILKRKEGMADLMTGDAAAADPSPEKEGGLFDANLLNAIVGKALFQKG